MTLLQPDCQDAGRSRTEVRPIGPLDIAFGFPFGVRRPPVPTGVRSHPGEVLRTILRAALLDEPCVLAFSGGRDSSLLLAVAAHVAATEGLTPPIAVTLRYPGDSAADESVWQDRVIEHLRKKGMRPEWICVDCGPELEAIGPLVAPLLMEYGAPLWPPALGPTIRLTEAAEGRTLITGEFGDEVLGNHRSTVPRAVVRRRGRGFSRQDWAVVGETLAPACLRRVLVRSEISGEAWLRPHLRGRYRRVVARDRTNQPLRWDRSVRTPLDRRSAVLGMQTLQMIAKKYRVKLVDPLGDPVFVEALGAYGGWTGLGNRTAVIRLLAGDLLPENVVTRRTKARFNAGNYGPRVAEFAERWTGRGVDEGLVDPEFLKATWASEFVPAQTGLLLQQAWLADQSAAVQR